MKNPPLPHLSPFWVSKCGLVMESQFVPPSPPKKISLVLLRLHSFRDAGGGSGKREGGGEVATIVIMIDFIDLSFFPPLPPPPLLDWKRMRNCLPTQFSFSIWSFLPLFLFFLTK